MNTFELYDKDFYAWTVQMAQALKSKALDQLDLEHLEEEMRIMGAREKSELRSRLKRILQHLLKWEYQPNFRGLSWELTITNQRLELEALLDDNPSLRPKIQSTLPMAYRQALGEARKETGLSKNIFPTENPYSINQILDDSYFP
jgi:hypothetical protein